jgi:hypothetical protein
VTDDARSIFNSVMSEIVGDTASTCDAAGIGAEDVQSPVPAHRAEGDLASKFRSNTEMALDVQRSIMSIPIDPTRPAYPSELRALATITNNQIAAQLRADEAAVVAKRGPEILEAVLNRMAVARYEMDGKRVDGLSADDLRRLRQQKILPEV